MKCSSIDLKAYLLDESPGDERLAAEEHLASCEACAQEFDRLQAVHMALLQLPEEDVPRRTVLVDRASQAPRSGWAFWRFSPAWVFASAAVLAAAIVVHAVTRPSPVAPAAVDTARIEALLEEKFSARLEEAVSRAVAESERRQAERSAQLVAEAEKRFQLERQEDRLAFQESFEVLRKRTNVLFSASADWGARQ